MVKTKRGNKFCYPNKIKSKKKKFTCYNKNHLIDLIKKWNSKNKSNKIKYKKSNSKKVLWKKLDDKFKNCDTEWCWINKLVENKTKFKKLFRPSHPKSWNRNNKEWLSNIDIEKVIKQYEDTYNNFLFIGAIPIDYDYRYKFNNACVSEKLCNLNIGNLLNRGITKIGVIFNTDKHHQPGSHWISLFIDLDRKGIYYFDSVGNIYPERIKKLIKDVKNQCHDINLNMRDFYNNISHQYGNSECGVYSINFIINMLTKKISFKKFCENIIHDKQMLKKRKYYFISPN